MKKFILLLNVVFLSALHLEAQYVDKTTGKTINGYLGPVKAPEHDKPVNRPPVTTPTTSRTVRKETNTSEDQRIKQADSAYYAEKAKQADDRRKWQEASEGARISSFDATKGDAKAIAYMYRQKMNWLIEKGGFQEAVRVHDTLVNYLKKINMPDDGFYDDLDWYTAKAYFGDGNYVNGMKSFMRSSWYAYLRSKPDGYTSLAGPYWEGFKHLPNHKEYLDSIKLISNIFLHSENPKGYANDHDFGIMSCYFKADIQLARVEIALGNYKAADEILDREIATYEKNKQKVDGSFFYYGYYYYRALSKYKQGDLKAAKKNCEKSIKNTEIYVENSKLLDLIKSGK